MEEKTKWRGRDWTEVATSQGSQQPPEAGKGRLSPQNSRSAALPIPWFTVWPPELWEQISLTLSHQVCDKLLQQTQKTNKGDYLLFQPLNTLFLLHIASIIKHYWESKWFLEHLFHFEVENKLILKFIQKFKWLRIAKTIQILEKEQSWSQWKFKPYDTLQSS